jgi:hypothetical protein
MTGITYTRGPAPVYNRLGDIKQPDGFTYSLFVFSSFDNNYYVLFREPQKNGFQVFDYIIHESALELIDCADFEKTDYCRKFLAMQPPEPAKEQWELKAILEGDII